ncbi:PREDICTED: major vault protein isoform X4 [Nanorana parkeri]|uniref:major vault protein isoform X4 n=1 Tax=Nanorana parkeri TaxID=125878 RepID=UPI0008543D15|nr:PREDICTED: major vault protein isoform X4 [Nanorana parkeri]
MSEESIIRIPPYHYIHVLDQNTNIARVETGPKTYIRQDNERVLFRPVPMVMVAPRHYCVIRNPVLRDAARAVQFDGIGQAKLRHGDQEIRLSRDPFPLYPGEELEQGVTPLTVVLANTALHLKALLDFEEDENEKFVAGDEWLFEGPGTYIPRKEVEVVQTIQATVIRHNQAIRLRARKECQDREDHPRVTGEEWLVKKVGAYLPGVYEEVVDIVDAFVLTDKRALHIRATKTFRDEKGNLRRTGEEWLVTMDDAEAYIPNVYEEVVGVVDITTLNSRQYCVILDPVGADGKPQLGQKRVMKGEKSFFLQPGENLESGIQDVYILSEEEGLVLRALQVLEEKDEDENVVEHKPGDRWMIRGPLEYVPPVEVEVVIRRESIPMDENEGIYVRDIKTGKVRSVVGQTYMLTQDEELWEKELPANVEALLASGKDPVADRSNRVQQAQETQPRDKTRAVTYRVPHNAAVQVYDYREKKARHFEVNDKTDSADASNIFSVPDFVGDACKAIASRIRGAVASVQFDDFHKNSNRIICSAVFGFDDSVKIRSSFKFPQNNLVITSVDIQSVEPVDQRTRDALQKSVQLAIEITTNSQEATARHEAERLEQEAKGRLERQRITDQAEAEKARKELLELEALSTAVESTGAAKAEAQSKAEAAKIEGEGAVLQAKLRAEALAIETEAELQRLRQARSEELTYLQEKNKLEILKESEVANIAVKKFTGMMEAIGADTIRDIALAGPELQVKLLKGLGIQSTLITDGSTPLNLFGTATGLLGLSAKPHSGKDEDA